MSPTAWPLHGIVIEAEHLRLSVTCEADLSQLVEVLPDDVQQNPSATRYAGLDERANSAAVLHQSYWSAMGSWTPADWILPFTVRVDGRVVGMQWLEGPDWLQDHCLDSSSWLVADRRGVGVGRQMRLAVLTLGFEHLGARAALSSAVLDNHASLSVSRRLGYVETHTSTLAHSGQTLQHLRLDREAWECSEGHAGFAVRGVDAALPLFGLQGTTA